MTRAIVVDIGEYRQRREQRRHAAAAARAAQPMAVPMLCWMPGFGWCAVWMWPGAGASGDRGQGG